MVNSGVESESPRLNCFFARSASELFIPAPQHLPKVLLMAEQDYFTRLSEIGSSIAASILSHHAGFHRLGNGKGSRRKALNQTIRQQYYVYRLWDRIRQWKLGSTKGIRPAAPSGLVSRGWFRSIASRERDANQLPTQRMPTLAVKKNDLKVSGVTNLAEADQ